MCKCCTYFEACWAQVLVNMCHVSGDARKRSKTLSHQLLAAAWGLRREM